MAESTLGSIANVGSAVRPSHSGGLASNRSYQLVLDVQGDEALIQPVGGAQRKVFPIYANLPERFHMEFSSNWNTPFEGKTMGDMAGSAADATGLGGGGMIGAGIDSALGAAGVGQKLKGQMVQTWENTSPLEMNFDLIFYAHENTEREIKERHLALLKLCAPTVLLGTQVLEAPGPKLLQAGGLSGRRINLFIGNYLQLTNVIIRSVGADLVSLFDENGIPIGMSINIAISTFNACLTGEELEQMFYGGQSWPTP